MSTPKEDFEFDPSSKLGDIVRTITGDTATFKSDKDQKEYKGVIFTFTNESKYKLTFLMANAGRKEFGKIEFGIENPVTKKMSILCGIEKKFGYDFRFMQPVKTTDNQIKIGVFKVSENYQGELWGNQIPDPIYAFNCAKDIYREVGDPECYWVYTVEGQRIPKIRPYEHLIPRYKKLLADLNQQESNVNGAATAATADGVNTVPAAAADDTKKMAAAKK